MPELPEVETIARGLAATIAGRTIAAAHVYLPKVVIAPKRPSLSTQLKGERIESVGRRGKYVVIALSSGRRLVVSLRMTGRLVVQPPPPAEPYPYTNVRIDFEDGTRLCYADVRQFGRMRVVEAADAATWDAGLGPEPLEAGFTPETFRAILRGRTTPIKPFLLDQKRIAGIGNIYACEALWEAQIRPSVPAGRISGPRADRLHAALIAVLHKAVHMRGTSSRDYVDAEGLEGGFQNELTVYGRAGEACRRCGRPLIRTVIAQRGTWWCRGCQR